MIFSERLVELRCENGYNTRAAFAEKMGIPVTTLKHYEDGDREPGHTFLKKVSELFNVSIDYLLCLTDEKEVLRSFRVSAKEQSFVEKYRTLDSYGSDLVDTVLEKEYERCNDAKENGTLQFTVKQETGKIAARNGRELSSDEKNRLLQILNSGT